MPLHVKCKCGKAMKIHARSADKKLACPTCKHPFRIPAAKFQAAGVASFAGLPAVETVPSKPAAAPVAKVTVSPPIPRAPVASPSTDPLPANLDLELLGESDSLRFKGESLQDDLLLELQSESAHAKSEAAPMAVVLDEGSPPQELDYARDHRKGEASDARKFNILEGPKRSFWGDALYSFVYPFGSMGNAVSMILVMIVATMKHPLQFAPCLLWLTAILLLYGCLCSVYFSVIVDTAAGSDDLPGIRMQDGIFEGAVKPALKFLAACALAFAPGAVFIALVANGVVPSSLANLGLVWLAGGIFLLPMLLLLFAMDSADMLARFDLIASSIARTILPYLGIWCMLLVVGALSLGTSLGSVSATVGMPSIYAPGKISGAAAAGVAIKVGFTMLDTYLMVVAMRVIGLYYLHYKQRFTLELE